MLKIKRQSIESVPVNISSVILRRHKKAYLSPYKRQPMFKEYHKTGHILVVEDNSIDVLVMKALLEKYFHLHVVGNGHDALKAMETNTFDIVLADINLKDDTMDGIGLLKKIRENKAYDSTRVFAVTAYYENRSYFLEQGFDELLTKPVIKEEILDILNQNLRTTAVSQN